MEKKEKNPISLQFPLKLSSLLQPFLYPWQVIISPINPASFIPGLWSSLLREKLIVISSQYLPESFLPERVVEKWKVKIVAQYATAAPGSLGASTRWANRAALIRAHLKCVQERQERPDWPWLSIRVKLNLFHAAVWYHGRRERFNTREPSVGLEVSVGGCRSRFFLFCAFGIKECNVLAWC